MIARTFNISFADHAFSAWRKCLLGSSFEMHNYTFGKETNVTIF